MTPRPQARLALIPARGGSKGIPRKNLARVGNSSLVERAVRTALEAACFDYVLVSTDDNEIADVARTSGALVPFLRSADASSDTASSRKVVAEVLEQFIDRGVEVGVVCLLEPTSPMRTEDIVRRAVGMAETDPFDGCLTLSPIDPHFHPLKQITLNDDAMAEGYISSSTLVDPPRRQALIPTYIRNGLAYAVRTDSFREGSGVCGFRPFGMIVEKPVINIDTPQDLEQARKLLGESAEQP